MEPSFRNAIWITKRGKKFVLKDMDDSHIINCISMLERENKTHFYIYRVLKLERDYRAEKGFKPVSRFDLMEFD